jgi:hypothetical protein
VTIRPILFQEMKMPAFIEVLYSVAFMPSNPRPLNKIGSSRELPYTSAAKA